MRVNWGLSNGWDCTRLVRNLHHVGRGRQIRMQITRRPVSRPIIGHKPSVNGASRAPPPTGRVSHGGYSILINTPINPNLKILHRSVNPCRALCAVQTQTSPTRSPLSVTGFAPSATKSPESSSEGQPNLTNPPAFVRERPKAGGFKHISLDPRICASKAQMPHPSGGYLRNLLRRGGSLGLFLFVLFLSEDKKSTPKSQTI